jgi:hypothetical protein
MTNYQKYVEWRKISEEMLKDGYQGSIDCGESVVREDFSSFAGLAEVISFDEMFNLEREYECQVVIERVSIMDNCPIDGEAYAILTDGERFAFAWGSEFPYNYMDVPLIDVLKSESGVQWFDRIELAESALSSALNAIDTTR